MTVRPIDIARKLNISTTTLRHYEERGLIPPVSRSTSGYRLFTDEHVAYFICIREMMAGFNLTQIAKILTDVMAKNIEAALWVVNKAQSDLYQDKIISEKIVLNLVRGNNRPPRLSRERLTIHDVSRETGVPATTIRYWDKVGLISVERDRENRYRLFTSEHIRQILLIYALKFSVYSTRRKYSVERVKEELLAFDADDSERIATIANDIKHHLDKVNRLQIQGIVALHRLYTQVEANRFGVEG